MYNDIITKMGGDMTPDKNGTVRKVNVLSIISFGLVLLMVSMFFSVSQYAHCLGYGDEFILLRNIAYLSSLLLGLAASFTGIFSLIRMKRFKLKGLWLPMSIIGSVIGTLGMILMTVIILWLMSGHSS
jgi:hypothetical protein